MVSTRLIVVVLLFIVPLAAAQPEEPPIIIHGGGGGDDDMELLDPRTGTDVLDAHVADLGDDGVSDLLLARADGAVEARTLDGTALWQRTFPGDAMAVTTLRLEKQYVAVAVLRHADDLPGYTLPLLPGSPLETALAPIVDLYLLDPQNGGTDWHRALPGGVPQQLMAVEQDGVPGQELVLVRQDGGDIVIQSITPRLDNIETPVLSLAQGELLWRTGFGGTLSAPAQYDASMARVLVSTRDIIYYVDYEPAIGQAKWNNVILPRLAGFEQAGGEFVAADRDRLWFADLNDGSHWDRPVTYKPLDAARMAADGFAAALLEQTPEGPFTVTAYRDGGVAAWTSHILEADDADLYHMGDADGPLAVVSEANGTVRVHALDDSGTATLLLEQEMKLAEVLRAAGGLLLVDLDGAISSV